MIIPDAADAGFVWDVPVLQQIEDADFVTFWTHAELPNGDATDRQLVTDSVTKLRRTLANARAELAAAGRSDLWILVDGLEGNFGHPNSQQATAIPNALYHGQALAEVAAAGGAALGSWGIEDCEGPVQPVDGHYGFQSYTIHALTSLELPSPRCPDAPATSGSEVVRGS